jgi:flagellar FliL protein
MSKPTAKPAAKEETPVAAPPKSKKMLVIGILSLLVLAAGGAGWYFTKGHAAAGHSEEAKSEPVHEPKFIPLGDNFTVNLQREESDQYLQAGVTLKILQPELEEKIKATLPEIRSKLLFLLSSKKPSELQSSEGKKKLVAEIIAETESVLGLNSALAHAAPVAPAHEEAPHSEAAASAPAAATQPAPVAAPKTTGVVDVLFTSFIIQ